MTIKNGFLLEDDRLFIPSTDINVFPCSRRGQSNIEGYASHYDPEARLNTERTNRLHTAANGFKDSFIINTDNNILTFVLAGYYVEVKNFSASAIASTLSATNTGTLYAHLRLRTDVSLDIEDYFTEILARQSNSVNNKNYLDVYYNDKSNELSNDFFVGVSFTKIPIESTPSATLVPKNLPLFSYINNEWQPVQASLLPKIEHGDTDNSIKFYGDFIVEHGEGEEKQTSFKVEKDLTTLGPTQISKLTVTDTALIEGKTTINNDVSANNITINENGAVKTPLLDAKTITSNFGNVIKVEKGLDVASGHAVLTDNVQADTIKSRADNGAITVDSPAKLSSTLTVTGKTTLQNGLDVTAGDTNLEKLSAGATDVASLVVDTTTQLKGTVNIAGATTVVGKATLQNGLAVTAGDTTLKKLNAEATDVASLAVTGNATLKNGLNVTAGDTTVKNLKADTTGVNSLTVDTTTKLKGAVSIDGETTIANSLNVTGTGGATTPSIKVDTITSKSTATDAAVTVKKPLKVEGGLTVTNAVNLNSTLNVVSKATLNNGLEVTSGETKVQSLSASGATTLQELTAAAASIDSLSVAGAAVVNDTITAEKLTITDIDGEVKTPQLRVNRITSDESDITVDNKKLIVNKSLEMLAKETATKPAEATIEKAVVGDLIVKKDTKLKDSTGTITASVVNSDDLNQKIGDTYRDVPVIFVQQLNSADSNVYQLQISRANVLPYKAN